MATRAPRSSFSVALLALVAAGGALNGGCFDSDDKFRVTPGTTGGESTSSTSTTDPSTSSTTDETTGGPSDVTCRDAIGCIQQCAVELVTMPMPEPDLSCILECVEQEGLNTREAYHLLRLANCAGESCGADGLCGTPGDTDTDTDGTGTGTSTTGPPPGPVGPLDPCMTCLFARMSDQSIPGCEEFHAACN